MNAHKPAELGLALIDAVDRASGGTSAIRDDDLTLLVLHHNAADPPPMSILHKARMMDKMLWL